MQKENLLLLFYFCVIGSLYFCACLNLPSHMKMNMNSMEIQLWEENYKFWEKDSCFLIIYISCTHMKPVQAVIGNLQPKCYRTSLSLEQISIVVIRLILLAQNTNRIFSLNQKKGIQTKCSLVITYLINL